MSLTYAESGVDREKRGAAKSVFSAFESTYSLSKYGAPVALPYNTVYPVGDKYNVKTCDGVGTKVMLAELAEKHDTIGIDAVAMVTNDAIRCGAEPIALTNVIDVKESAAELLAALQKGLQKGSEQSGCPMVGGETADVPELMTALYHINCDCVAEVEKSNVVDGKGIADGDAVVGIPSSGLHSNGISLVRRALFKKWGGKYGAHDKPDGLERELVFEALEPTRVYVKPVLKAITEYSVKAAVHITGDAYLKFGALFKSSPGIGFAFDKFEPQPIFGLIQEQGVDWKEMFRTFNMGWGFALVVPSGEADAVAQLVGGTEIGKATGQKGEISVSHNGKEMNL
ncbi:MAG: phosphoribosylformylglycinamidine cyclo-ligase [Candidatus Diapherotrites archaeon]|nr:phosphoribosylformylglycinamidine cyclo-ligase [Candidatus Diapherotrites archaeon]